MTSGPAHTQLRTAGRTQHTVDDCCCRHQQLLAMAPRVCSSCSTPDSALYAWFRTQKIAFVAPRVRIVSNLKQGSVCIVMNKKPRLFTSHFRVCVVTRSRGVGGELDRSLSSGEGR